MALFLFQNKPATKIEALEVEITISENHEFSNVVTSYPVDVGFNITDHVQQQPPRLTITGLTSNTPVQYFTGKISKLVREDLTNRIADTFKILLNYTGFQLPVHAGQDSVTVINPRLLTIKTGLMIYRDMIIQKLSFPREKSTGESLQYTLELVQIRKVKSKYKPYMGYNTFVGEPTQKPEPSAGTFVGEQQQNAGKVVATEVTSQSYLVKGWNWLTQ